MPDDPDEIPVNMPSKATRASLAKLVGDLPMLPTVLAELLALSPKDKFFFDKLTHIAEREPALTARLMMLANAPSNAPVSPIIDIRQSATRIGTERVMAMLTAVTVITVFVPSTPEQALMWRHSILTATVAKTIAENAVSDRSMPPDQAYACGLMHDIGLFILLQHRPEELDKLLGLKTSSPNENVALEFEMLGYDHTHLGGLACEKWRMPDFLCHLVKNHHAAILPSATVEERQLANAVKIIQMANSLVELLDRRPRLLEEDVDVICNLTRLAAIPPAWGEDIPIDPAVLQPLLPATLKEANRVVDLLGLRFDS